MLLPSALTCDGGRAIPSSTTMLFSPAPRNATRIPQVALFAEESSSYPRSSAVEGIFMTCKKLHQILSLEPPRSASPTPHQASATTQTHNAFNRAIASPLPSTDAPSTLRQPLASQTLQVPNTQSNRLAVPSQIPRTPIAKNSDIVRIPKTPMRRNKRCRADDSDDDGFYRVRVQSPKRPRLSTLPGSTMNQSMTAQSSRFNRRSRQLKINTSMRAVTPEASIPSTSLTQDTLQMSLVASSEKQVPQTDIVQTTQTDNGRDWSNAEDRLLVEMVLQKMRLSPRDWADCARSLGRDPRTVGNRWEMIVGNLMGGVREGRVGGAVHKRKRIEDSERR